MILRPIDNKIIIRPRKPEEVTKGGLFIPDAARDKAIHDGEVIAVGPGRLKSDGTRIEMKVKVGDNVVYNEFAGVEIDWEGEKLLVMADHDVCAIIVTNAQEEAEFMRKAKALLGSDGNG